MLARGGLTGQDQSDRMPGFPGQPMSRDNVERKFNSNIGKRWTQERTKTALQAQWALGQTDDLPSLLSKLASQT
jgi:2-methylcitrate dehydratase